MRDYDFRRQLDPRLRDAYAQEPTARILPEIVLSRGANRIDFAFVNGRLQGYEIKSDSDTLERLTAQAAAYNLVFDEITLVAGSRHLEAARKAIPPWWGIVKAEILEGAALFTDLRQPEQNPMQWARALADLLWRDEASFA